MRLPSSPLGIFLSICAVVVPAGIGLTAPVWLMIMGMRLDLAASMGARIVGVTVVCCAALALAYRLVIRPRLALPAAAVAVDDGPVAESRLVHMIVWCLFLLPFALIVVGFIIGQLDQVTAAD